MNTILESLRAYWIAEDRREMSARTATINLMEDLIARETQKQ
jgi:hypothetical protein